MNSDRRPVFVLCPARNEVDNLKRMVPAWLLFADHVVIADQNSDDGTAELFAGHERVTVIRNPSREYDEAGRAELLVKAARELSERAVHLYLDADETLSGNVLDSPEWKLFCADEPGTAGAFTWAQLWKTPRDYLDGGKSPFAFIDDGRPFVPHARIHSSRGVGTRDPKKVFTFQEVVNLHNAWLSFDRSVRKNYWYMAWFTVQGAKSYYVNRRNHGWYWKVDKDCLLPTPDAWVAPYRARGIDVTSTATPELMWQEVEVLRWFREHGEKRFYLLDIWRTVDWEAKRQLALAAGHTGLPEQPIKPPPDWLKLYTGLNARKAPTRELVTSLGHRVRRLLEP